MASYFGQGGKLLLCTPCIKGRNIAPETLVADATLIAGARVVQECLEAGRPELLTSPTGGPS
jgi:hypothetical protein